MAFKLSPTYTPPRPLRGGPASSPTLVAVPLPAGVGQPRLGASAVAADAAFAAWEAHLDAGRIGGGPPPRAPAREGYDYGLASLERILAAGRRTGG